MQSNAEADTEAEWAEILKAHFAEKLPVGWGKFLSRFLPVFLSRIASFGIQLYLDYFTVA